MRAKLIDGRHVANSLKKTLASQIHALKKKKKIVPSLAIIRIGSNKASQVYVASKCRQCEEIGMISVEHSFPEGVAEDTILDIIQHLNVDSKVHGIILQLPLPRHLDAYHLISAINPEKDVDGLHPINMGRLAMGEPGLVPCTPLGCLELLKRETPLVGKHAVIIGRSNLVGKPLALLLLNENCTVTLVHRQTKNIEEICRQADILVAAAGQPKLVKASWVKPGAIVLDVGINHLVDDQGHTDLVGDVDFEDVETVAGALTPVPGGVGPMTVVSLLRNTYMVAAK